MLSLFLFYIYALQIYNKNILEIIRAILTKMRNLFKKIQIPVFAGMTLILKGSIEPGVGVKTPTMRIGIRITHLEVPVRFLMYFR